MNTFYSFSLFGKRDNCKHVITTKDTEEPLAFSLALHTGEEKHCIDENRNKIVSEFSWNKRLFFVTANQTHSDNIIVITERKNQGWDNMEDAISDCDALITNQKDIVLTMLTADCVPILLMDIKNNTIGVVHAGWRGTTLNIVRKTVQKMCDIFDCQAHHIIVGIGPSIGKCCYEVGDEVAKNFLDIPHGYDKKGQKFMLDLPYVNKQQLLKSGVLESNIEMSGICTSCEVDRFFSYRKEKGCSGRFMSMLCLV